MQIRRLSSDDELTRAFAVMRELRPHLTEDTYRDLLDPMVDQGYELWAVIEDDDIKALAGIAFRTNFYYGRYVWVFDLITASEERSRGHGAALLKHVERLGRDRGCDTIALASALHRHDAHRFYEEKMGYERPSYVFKKSLRS